MKKYRTIVFILGVILICIGCALSLMKPTSKTQKVTVHFKDEENNLLYEKTVSLGDTVQRIEPDKKEGYVFIDWYYESKLYDFDQQVTKNITLIGKWEEELHQEEGYVVAFYNDDDTLYETQFVPIGGKVSEPKIPTSENGGTFIGWYIEDEAFDFSMEITKKINLKAHYSNDDSLSDSTTPPDPNGTNSPSEIENPDFNFPASDFIKETDILVEPRELILKVGKSSKLNISIVPDNASIKDHYAYCEDSSICSVDEAFVVTARTAGKTNIIVETFHGIKKMVPITVEMSYYTLIEAGTLYIFNIHDENVEGDVTVQFTDSGEIKKIHVPNGGVAIVGNVKVLSIEV